MASKMSMQGFLVISSCLSTLLLLGWMSHIQSNLNQMNGQTKLQVNNEHDSMDSPVRKKRAIGGPPVTTDLGLGGAVYVRWGRMDCPADAELIYKGIVAGTHSTHTGGGSNLLCVTDEPEWDKIQAGANGHSYIYGAEFIGTGPDIIFEHDLSEKLLNHDALCAVCRSQVRMSQVMIPGRLTCSPNWVKEYHGYLMSALYSGKGQTSYICVDATPQVDNRSYKTEGGVQLYPVEATCGTMPCPKYETGRELTCVVCTK